MKLEVKSNQKKEVIRYIPRYTKKRVEGAREEKEKGSAPVRRS